VSCGKLLWPKDFQKVPSGLWQAAENMRVPEGKKLRSADSVQRSADSVQGTGHSVQRSRHGAQRLATVIFYPPHFLIF
jgi:hypothetical protein